MHMNPCLSSIVRRAAAVGFFAAAATFAVQAQQSSNVGGQKPALLLSSAVTAPLTVDLTTPDTLNYSSSAGVAETAAAERFNLSGKAEEGNQPPPRRRYGRPNYHDNRTNPDGSSKYAFEIGGGLTVPVGNTFKYLKTSYAIQGGVGRNFSRQFGIMAEFNWDNFVFQNNNLGHQLALYNSLGATDQSGSSLSVLGGNSHVWSLSIDPRFNLVTSETGSAYVVAGVGFYHKTANFTIPSVGTYCDYYGFCYQYQANQSIDKYTSNAPGFNLGVGLTHKVSRFANEQFYAEVRYVFVDNTQKYFAGTAGATANSTNLYPANSNRTSYVPITVGLRF